MQSIELLKSYLNMIDHGFISGLIVYGESGIGKSYNVYQYFKNKKGISWLTGHVTPLSLFKFLKAHHTNTIILDDIDEIVYNKTALAILKAALWGNQNKRTIQYHSTHYNEQNPEVNFTGNIILCLNHFPDNHAVKAVLDRCFSIEFKLSYSEKIELIKIICKNKEIVNFIVKNTSELTPNFNMRTYLKILGFYRYNKKNWKKLSINLLEPDEKLRVIKELETDLIPLNQKIKEFQKITNLSRASYFRIKKLIKH